MTHRNRDAAGLYGIIGAGALIALVSGLLTPQRLAVTAFIAAVSCLLLRYLLPLSATVVDREVVFRWPLRRVVVTPANLVTARLVRNALGGQALALRTRGAVRWDVVLDRYVDAEPLGRALDKVVRQADGLDPHQREVALRYLRSRSTSR